MSVNLAANGTANGSFDVQVVAGRTLVLRVSAFDPNGINRIFVQCYQFSMATSNKIKLATGEVLVSTEDSFQRTSYEVSIDIPENAALGKWGVQMIEFTNGRGYKTAFYRGQGKFDNILFEVVPPPTKEDELIRFHGVEFGSSDRCA
jgi:hypothetical protein